MPKLVTPTELVEDTIRFYSEDPVGRRAVGLGGIHMLKSDGRMCALGRCAKAKYLSPDVTGFVNTLGLSGGDDRYVEIMRSEYAAIPYAMWRRLQKFHDQDWFWTRTGLSSRGEAYAAKLLEHAKHEESESA